ncbi:hypothetical protein [Schlesneria sp. T3-172]|uniref:hypothetical protein n=1 Tax=Schlesneria sphaerica TaxID=3373610 RepID=UPI0037C74D97
MSGQTHRDVVIRVAIQPGDSSTFSAALNAAQRDVQSMAAAMQREMEAAFAAARETASGTFSGLGGGGIGGGGAGGFGGGGGARRGRGRNWGSPAAGTFAAEILAAGGATNDLAERLAQEGAIYPTREQSDRRIRDATIAQNERDAAHRRDEEERRRQREQLAQERQDVFDNDVANAVRATNAEKAKRKKEEEDAAREEESKAAAEVAGNTRAAATALWGLTTAIKVWMTTIKDAETSLHGGRQRDIADAQTVSGRRIADMQAQSSYWASRANVETNVDAFRELKNRPANLAREAGLREMEERTDITPQRKAELRSRAERNAGQDQQRAALKDEMSHLRTQEYDLSEAEKSARARMDLIKETGASTLRTIGAKLDEAENTPGAYFGLANSKQQNSNIEELQLQYRQQQLTTAQQLKDTAEEIASIEARQVQLQQQKTTNLGEQYKITKQQQQDAYEAVRDHKEGMRQDAVGFGASSYGEQARARMLDEKLSRIKAQQAAGETVEQLLPHEMQLGKSMGLGTAIIDEQARAQHDKNPLKNWDRSEEQLREKEADLKAKMAIPTEDNLAGQMEASVQDVKSAVASSMKSLEVVAEVAKMVNETQQRLSELENQVRLSRTMRGQSIQAWW